MRELEIAAYACDCYEDEIIASGKCNLYIYEPSETVTSQLTSEMWKDSCMNGLAVLV